MASTRALHCSNWRATSLVRLSILRFGARPTLRDKATTVTALNRWYTYQSAGNVSPPREPFR
eukprot:9243430-Pyramimonas_sp.AAC.1